ncbi:pyruvate dehydrogenase (acetyl-transferring), homodimeric type [Stratiformator vulcanicus]|uniref:Pyruvate dehydrogenase E1 component n=1 Tax=Stratiformator vulcanicus TaxID=2527980 RepID=A0A517QXN0_9PLAN|nr:pyruvate dehydrogenase (acetyl-transferring), homodimeric type [Stratiformator vulcanicus]QDT36348.1 Pyruvate dehydrogenase E1 component [Stratiformator vulcanicus]
MSNETVAEPASGIDELELQDWYESLEDILYRYGPEEAGHLLEQLEERAARRGVVLPFSATTPYQNTIPLSQQPEYPGDMELEQKIRRLIRWNAAVMVVRANKHEDGIGGHISTYASSCTLYEVGFNHFFHARTDDHTGDMVYFQGHASPGMYARAFIEGRLEESHLENFRRELPRGSGLSSYPHPWLMPEFWQFPTVSMGLGPITSIYHARFLRYLKNRGVMETDKSNVWCFLGDGEMDEPESLGAITLPAREKLDNLIWVINCNLQRLDGPVRGNAKIIQEMEGIFRGAGWNVLKVVWGSTWDKVFEKDEQGKLVKRLGEMVDGEYQRLSIESGAENRAQICGDDEDLHRILGHFSDEEIDDLRRGGHSQRKVYAAYKKATDRNGKPTVVLAKTIKGWGLGSAGEGKNVAHNAKKMTPDELKAFRSRFSLNFTDEELQEKPPFLRPENGSPEYEYLHSRRKELGGFVPARRPTDESLQIPALDVFSKYLEGTREGQSASTTFVFGQIIALLMRDKNIGKRVVPIIPDEARTFGMEGLFKQVGIYAPFGQLYEPVDRNQLMYYKESQSGQLLEEGINEAGAMSSFIAAGTAYANLGYNMIPFYVYYSMFGFQRVGDLCWLAGDSRTKGFLVGGTSGRTSLNGEGLQHQDGHSQLMASTIPNLVAYDPAYAFELTVIIQDGLRRMYADGEQVFYYLSVYNDNYEMPRMPEDDDGHIREGVLRGMYQFSSTLEGKESKASVRPQLFGSGPIMNCVREAQDILAEKFGIGTDAWSVTSYNELQREARACTRWNRLNSDKSPRKSFLENQLDGIDGPVIAASDNIRAVQDQVREWVPTRYVALGTDGFGRSETRDNLRRHFEVDAESIVYATLAALAEDGHFDKSKLPGILKDFGINPETIDPIKA